jgi:hypothetical protein
MYSGRGETRMHRATYWPYFDHAASTALAIVSQNDTKVDPPSSILQSTVGIVIGFNPPQPTFFPVAGNGISGSKPMTADAATFHVQAQRRLASNALKHGLALPEFLVFINLFDIIGKDPRVVRNSLALPVPFPCKTSTVITKIDWAVNAQIINAQKILWICCAWGMTGCKCDHVLRHADRSVMELKRHPLAAQIRVLGFASRGLPQTSSRHALDCAHIGYSKSFMNKVPDWHP